MYFTNLFFFLLLGFSLSNCNFCPNEKIIYPQKEWEFSEPQSQGVNEKNLESAMQYMDSICGEYGNSRSLVIKNGYVIWKGTDVESRQLVWSCTKSFMSTCFGLLWDDEKCSPETLAKQYFPKLNEYYPQVTLEHFLTFTSGYNHEANNPFEPTEPMYKPGEAFHYSSQSDALAMILTMIGQESLSDLFNRRIANNIGIKPDQMEWKSKVKINGITINGGAGMPESGVYINALAMARFGWLYCCNGNWDGQQLISKRYIKYASSPRVSPEVPSYLTDGWYTGLLPGNYGLNWWVNGQKPDGTQMWPHAPEGTFAAQGNKNNICFIIPSWNMVIVRLGGDVIIDTDLYDGVFERLGEVK